MDCGMTREDIIAMAREANFYESEIGSNEDGFVHFATLVAAAERANWPAEMQAMERQVSILTDALAQAKAEEREACAKVCDALESNDADWDSHHWNQATQRCAFAIRARGNT